MIRLFVTSSLSSGKTLSLTEAHRHYLLHVMRLQAGDSILVFNGTDGEWQADIQILTKKLKKNSHKLI